VPARTTSQLPGKHGVPATGRTTFAFVMYADLSPSRLEAALGAKEPSTRAWDWSANESTGAATACYGRRPRFGLSRRCGCRGSATLSAYSGSGGSLFMGKATGRVGGSPRLEKSSE
jgi:hypothetical protein